jgi:acyl carrier protein
MEEKVVEIIIGLMKENDVDINLYKIDENTKFSDDLGLDSFNLAQLTVLIESEFGIDIFENGIITSVGDIFKQLK